MSMFGFRLGYGSQRYDQDLSFLPYFFLPYLIACRFFAFDQLILME